MDSVDPAIRSRPPAATPPPKKLLVYNPVAGDRTGRKKAGDLCRIFAGMGWPVLPVPTSGPGTASGLVRRFQDEIDGVIALGGDGTINDILQAVAGTGLWLGVMPGGTANVIAREVGMPRRLDAAAAALVNGQHRQVTVGKAGGRFFLAMAGIGFDARVAEHVTTRAKRVLGRGAFTLAAVRCVLGDDFSAARFTSGEGQWSAPFGVVANTRLYGGQFELAPRASLEDPALDLCLFQRSGAVNYLRYFLQLWRKCHTRSPGVIYVKTRRVEIEGPASIPYQLDGEPAGRLPLIVESVPRALTLIFPG